MRAQGYKFAYYLQDYDWDTGTPGEIVSGPFEASDGAIEKLKELYSRIQDLDSENKLVLGCCWINDEGEIVG